MLYHAPALLLKLVGVFVRRIGEPLRSAFTPAETRALLERHGFGVVRDEDLATVGARLSAELARNTRRIHHLRVVTADARR